MKILVICQHYYPEPFRITDICEELVKRGNDVTVLTGTPNYPMGYVYEGYEKGKKAEEILNGVKVRRLKTAPRKTGIVNRLINYFSYARKSKKFVKKLDKDFDVVFVNQLSPVMMAEAGLKYKKRYGKKVVLYSLDLWPQSLVVGGIKEGSIIYRVFDKISKRIYRQVDSLLITSKTFKEYFTRKIGINEQKITYLPQYAESQFLGLKEKTPTDQFRLLFAGNLGTAQSVHTIIESARLLKDQKIIFDIVGDGSEFGNLKESAKDLPNVIFHGRKSLDEAAEFYQNADATLITLTPDVLASSTLPGKVQSYMAAGKAIVGAVNGETAVVLAKAQGDYCASAGDSVALAEYIKKLVASGNAVEIGKKNREYYLNTFSKEKFFEVLIDALEKAIKE